MANAFLSTAFALNVWRYSVKEGIQCGASGEHGCGGAWKRSREAAVEVRSRDGKLWECVYETCLRERLRFPTSPRGLRLTQVKSWMIVSDNKLDLQYWSKFSGFSILWIACVGIWYHEFMQSRNVEERWISNASSWSHTVGNDLDTLDCRAPPPLST